MKTVIFAGGCFWCVEHDLHSAPGVIDVISGYMSSSDDVHIHTPTYENHEGFREAVRVTYHPGQTDFKKLCQYFLDHIDPTDEGGQFGDRGESYKTAIYVKDSNEKEITKALLLELDQSNLYHKKHAVEVFEEGLFYNAEEYHQNYSFKNHEQYMRYREISGREAFVQKTCIMRDEKKLQWKE